MYTLGSKLAWKGRRRGSPTCVPWCSTLLSIMHKLVFNFCLSSGNIYTARIQVDLMQSYSKEDNHPIIIYICGNRTCATYSKISFSSIVFILLVFAFFNLQWENCHFQPWKLINWCGVLTHPFSSSKDKENRFKFPISISTSWCQNIWVTLKIMVPCWRLGFLY